MTDTVVLGGAALQLNCTSTAATNHPGREMDISKGEMSEANTI